MRKAWLQMKLATLTADNPSGRPTKAQRQEAKEAVAARCEEEAQSGKFRRMRQFPVLWDGRTNMLYFGGASATASEHFVELFSRAFKLELERYTVGRRARHGPRKRNTARRRGDCAGRIPRQQLRADIAWWNNEAGNFDFLGNEFLLWLWWRWETQSDTIALPGGSEVTGMLARTLSLQCPRGESGRETITAEAPARLPEAAQAIRSGKLPRKSGLMLVRHGEQYELVLQAETFSVTGAKIHADETGRGRGILEDRIESFRGFRETIDLLFRAFCERRIGKGWSGDLERMRRWLKTEPRQSQAACGQVQGERGGRDLAVFQNASRLGIVTRAVCPGTGEGTGLPRIGEVDLFARIISSQNRPCWFKQGPDLVWFGNPTLPT